MVGVWLTVLGAVKSVFSFIRHDRGKEQPGVMFITAGGSYIQIDTESHSSFIGCWNKEKL